MTEPNNSNVAADAYVIAAAVGRLSAAERAFYEAAARTYATRVPTSQNAPFWTDLAALIATSHAANSAASISAQAAIKRSGLSVSASTQSQLMALGQNVEGKLLALRSPSWPWLAAGAVGLWLLSRRRRAS
jgi:hypothetical protein